MDNFPTQELQEKLTVLQSEIEDLQKKLQDGEIVKSPEEYKKVSKSYSEKQGLVNAIEEILRLREQLVENEEMANLETDEEMLILVRSEIDSLKSQLEKKEAELDELLVEKEPYDDGNAIVEIRAGAGGDEAALFAQEMYRAYSKYAEAEGYKVELASVSYGQTGGFKEVIFFVNGDDVFKNLKYESGVHRVQRVPVTESSGRIHTSAVSVVVLPEIPETEVDIDPKDLRIDVYRAGGPGGQSVNTTDSAVRIVHIPTNITVTCQDEKSQHKNKAKALKILQAKLYDIAAEESAEKIGDIRKNAIKTGDRSAKIRTYNFPQSRVTDHRIKQSWHNLAEVMEGSFSEIIAAVQRYFYEQKKLGK